MRLQAADLRAHGREPPLPCRVSLPEGELEITQWLRVLPSKRLVGRGVLAGRPVLAKLFVAAAAERHWARELQGLEALVRFGIQTPGLIAMGRLQQGGCYLISEYLDGARTLKQQWMLEGGSPDQPAAHALLSQALAAIARLHACGLRQNDLHMGNFLLQGEQLYTIDGDDIEVVCEDVPLPARAAEDNLALFFALLPSSWDDWRELLLVDYLRVNPARALNLERLCESVRLARQGRLKDWLGKALRDCSAFAMHSNWWRFDVVVREQVELLEPLLQNPDKVFDTVPKLKNGGSSSVTRLRLNERQLVIKRYNIKSLGHWLRRFWRPSRAWHSWLAAHRLQFLDIATPAPLAMCESRFGPLRRRAWLVTEFCPGQDLLSLFDPTGQELPAPEQRQALLKVFSELARQRISHGDCKATNLLWHQGRVWLIDLDAMQAHSSEAAWRRAWAEDRARLIRNWPAGSPLALWLDEQLPR